MAQAIRGEICTENWQLRENNRGNRLAGLFKLGSPSQRVIKERRNKQ
jgi:hypothetical protein